MKSVLRLTGLGTLIIATALALPSCSGERNDIETPSSEVEISIPIEAFTQPDNTANADLPLVLEPENIDWNEGANPNVPIPPERAALYHLQIQMHLFLESARRFQGFSLVHESGHATG